MKFYEEYISNYQLDSYTGNLQVYGNYKWGYLNLSEQNILIIIPELKEMNRSFHGNLVNVNIQNDYPGNIHDYLELISREIGNPTQILFGSIVNNKSSNEFLKLAGILEVTSKYSFGKTKKNVSIYQFIPYDRKYPPFYVPSNISKSGRPQYDVYAYIQYKEWKTDSKFPIGMCQKIIGSLGNTEADYEYILINYGLNFKKIKVDTHISSFIEKKGSIRTLDNGLDRQDYRQYHSLSIDPLGCQDIDDVISVSTFSDYYLIQVHIADVSNFVLENSYLDNVAMERISSIYSPHKQINMLPEELSTNLCSLLEKMDRLVMSVNYYCDLDFKIKKVDFTNGLINCDFNLEYDIADQLLNKIKNKITKKYPSWVSQDLSLLHKFVQSNNILDRALQTLNSHDIIDTMMVMTNSRVARFLHQNVPNSLSLLRTHHQTDINQLEKVSQLNEIVSDTRVSDFLEIYYSHSAEYTIGNELSDSDINHYGLNIKFYTHFTSPIRRYWDILVHRQLKKIIKLGDKDLGPTSNLDENKRICQHINHQHKNIKLCQRHLDNRQILETYLDSQKLETQAFITKLSDQYLQIYIPEMNICHDFKPFSRKLDSLLKYQYQNEQLLILNKHNHKQVSFKVMDPLEISLVYFKFYPIDKQLSISIIKPNILLLIN